MPYDHMLTETKTKTRQNETPSFYQEDKCTLKHHVVDRSLKI